MEFELKYPLLNRKWKWIAISFFLMPFIILIITVVTSISFPQESVADLIYLCWAIAFGLLNFTKQKQEDEMIEQLRLKSFAMGVYYLMWGLGALIIIQSFAFGSFFTDFMSAYLALWLLNTYIFLSFQFYKWKNS